MLPVFLFFCFLWSGSCPLPFFWQSSLLLRAGFAKNFRERTFVFAFFFGPCVFGMDLPMVFCVFFRNFAPKCFRKIRFF